MHRRKKFLVWRMSTAMAGLGRGTTPWGEPRRLYQLDDHWQGPAGGHWWEVVISVVSCLDWAPLVTCQASPTTPLTARATQPLPSGHYTETRPSLHCWQVAGVSWWPWQEWTGQGGERGMEWTEVPGSCQWWNALFTGHSKRFDYPYHTLWQVISGVRGGVGEGVEAKELREFVCGRVACLKEMPFVTRVFISFILSFSCLDLRRFHFFYLLTYSCMSNLPRITYKRIYRFLISSFWLLFIIYVLFLRLFFPSKSLCTYSRPQ